MGLFKCMNKRCWSESGRPGFDFEDGMPVCPKCNTDQRDKRLGYLIVDRVLIHYDPPHDSVDGVGKGYIACSKIPVHEVAMRGQQASGEPVAVNCQKCKESAEWPKDWIEMDPKRVPLIIPSKLGG